MERGSQRSGQPEASVEEPGNGGKPKAVGGAKVLREATPGTAAYHTATAVPSRPGRAVGGMASETVVPAVRCPLPDIAMHVVESPGVRPEVVHRHSPSSIFARPATAGINGSSVIISLVRRD